MRQHFYQLQIRQPDAVVGGFLFSLALYFEAINTALRIEYARVYIGTYLSFGLVKSENRCRCRAAEWSLGITVQLPHGAVPTLPSIISTV